MITHIEVYSKRVRGGLEYFWRGRRKGRIVLDGAESYKRKSTLFKTLKGIVSGGFKLPE